ncbi:MAG: phosphatidylglycerophosphatase A [Pseudomonadota bacterium]
MPERPSPALLRHPLDLLALGFGSGLLPKAPGTAGTAVGIPCYLLLQPLAPAWYLVVTAALFALGVAACAHAARGLGVHDHPAIVWDEIVGYLVTMTLAPAGWQWIAVGFVLFRLFDILKPWPIRWFDRRVHGGLGIMLDDLVAGLCAAGVLQLLVRYVPGA